MKRIKREEPKKPAPEGVGCIVINFGDGTRVLYNARGRTQSVPVGGTVDIMLSEKSIERIRSRDETLVILSDDIAEKAKSPWMKRVLDTLRDFDLLTYEYALQVAIAILGDGQFSNPRPSKIEIRLALARRAKDAAFYIQKGANETADQLLGEGREVKPLEQASDGVGVVPGDLVQGDPEEGDDDGKSETEVSGNEQGAGASAEGNCDGLSEGHAQQNGNQQPGNTDEGHGEAGGGSAPAEQAGSRRQRPVTGKPA